MLTFQGHKDSVYAVAFSYDGSFIISGSSDNMIILCDIKRNGKLLKTFVGHQHWVKSVAFSPR